MTDRLTEIMHILEHQQAELDVTPAGTFARILGIDTTARAIMALDGWRPIETAPPTNYHSLIDIWLVNRKTGEGWRSTDCRFGGGGWIDSRTGKWVTGKRYINDDGDDVFDPTATDERSTVATHWRPAPPAPEPQR